MFVFRKFILLVIIFFAGLHVYADDHYRLILRNKTKYPIDVKISSTVDGLDYVNIKSIRVAAGDVLSQEQRIGTSTRDSIVRIDNDFETCILNQGSYPIAIPSDSIHTTEPLTTLEVASPRNKKYACVVSLR
tara:strand:+ start:3354 stop:3749 length:396 start_codon:yes stop_codon:yes gene_type:complete